MRHTTAQHRLTLSGYSSAKSTAVASVVTYEGRSRAIRAVKGVAGAWMVGLAGAFIPVAHLLIVPVAFFAGLSIGYVRLRTTKQLVSVTGACPDCKSVDQWECGTRWPLHDLTCRACHRTVSIIAGSEK